LWAQTIVAGYSGFTDDDLNSEMINGLQFKINRRGNARWRLNVTFRLFARENARFVLDIISFDRKLTSSLLFRTAKAGCGQTAWTATLNREHSGEVVRRAAKMKGDDDRLRVIEAETGRGDAVLAGTGAGAHAAIMSLGGMILRQSL